MDDIDDDAVHEAILDEYEEEFRDYLELQDLDDDDDDDLMMITWMMIIDDYYQPNWQNDWNDLAKAKGQQR